MTDGRIAQCSAHKSCPECTWPNGSIADYIRDVVEPELVRLRAERDSLLRLVSGRGR